MVVEDPETWTRPWTVAFSLTRDVEYRIFKYACHEGNYAIANMLRGFRAVEAGRWLTLSRLVVSMRRRAGVPGRRPWRLRPGKQSPSCPSATPRV